MLQILCTSAAMRPTLCSIGGSRAIAGLDSHCVYLGSFIPVSQLLKLPNIDRKHNTLSQRNDQKARNWQQAEHPESAVNVRPIPVY